MPVHVTQIKVIARGAHGVGSPVSDGGRVHAVIPVTPGEKLVIYVGGDASGSTGGFNGGANGGQGYYCSCPGYGGGGATDVRERGSGLGNRVLVAGGSGGQGGSQGAGGSGGYGAPDCGSG